MTGALAASGGMVAVAARPHPFDLARVARFVPPGTTLAAIVAAEIPAHWLDQARVRLAGEPIDPALWRLVRPKAGATVEITVVPAGGNTLRTVLMIAVVAGAVAFAPYLVPGVLAGGALGAFSTAVVTAGLTTVGMLAVNALVPPQQPGLSSGGRSSPTYSLSGARNTARPRATIPVVLGRHRLAPPLAAQVTSYMAGSELRFRMLCSLGYGPLFVEDVRLGETPAAAFADLTVAIDEGEAAAAPVVALFADTPFQDSLNDALTQAAGWITRTTQPDTDEIGIDTAAPEGLVGYGKKTGDRFGQSVTIENEYRLVGEDDWVALDDTVLAANTTSAVRQSFTVEVARGQYEVRRRRVTVDSTEDTKRNKTVWTVLRSIRHVEPIAEAGTAAIAIDGKVGEQLQGYIDELNCVCTTVCLDWDSEAEAWVERATRNPASLYRRVLQGTGAADPVPDSGIDLERLAYWHELCVARGYACDLVVDFEADDDEILAIVAACGRAVPARPDGRWSVAIDEPQSLVVQELTPRSIMGFRQRRLFIQEAHALRIPFTNAAEGYRLDERTVYADGFDAATATRIEEAELPGITDAGLVHHFGRLMLARARFAQESAEIDLDWRNLIATKGDLIRVAHDIVLWGAGWGRIADLTLDNESRATLLTLDERIVMEGGKVYVARIQRADGTGLMVALRSRVGESAELEPEAPIAALDLPAAGDQVIVGETGREAQLLVVLGITPGPDLTATLACAPYVDLSSVDREPIPPFESLVTLPAGYGVPVVESIRSDETVAQREPDGTIHLRAVVTIFGDGSRPLTQIEGLELRWRPAESGGAWRFVQGGRDAVEVWLDGVESGSVIEVQARWRGVGAIAGAWSAAATHEIVGVSLPPPDVDVVWQDGDQMRWRAEIDVDHQGWLLRTAAAAGMPWSLAQPLHAGVFGSDYISVGLLPAGAIELLVKATTKGALESTSAARGAVSADQPAARYPLQVSDLASGGWPGTLQGCEIVEGELHSTTSTARWPSADGPAWRSADAPAFDAAWDSMLYETDWAVPEAAIAGDRIELDVDATAGVSVLISWASGDSVAFADGDSFEEALDDADDFPDDTLPFGAVATFSATSPFVLYRGPIVPVPGGLLAVRLAAPGGGAADAAYGLTITLAAAEDTRSFADVEIPVEGVRLVAEPPLRQVIRVLGLLQDGDDARTIRVAEKTSPSGPLVKAYDAAGDAVAGVADIALTGV
jgi:hypothetical protein